MKRYQTTGIVLRRVDYGEADRIITFLTPERGAISAMAKGVRKPSSKLAGGIELFSESNITVLEGKANLDHLISSRLITHYRHIVSDYERVETAYSAIEAVNKIARQFDDNRLYELLLLVFKALDNTKIPAVVTELWFKLNFLAVLGQQPDLIEDAEGKRLESGQNYQLDPAEAVLVAKAAGSLTTDHIKTWRLMLTTKPDKATSVKGVLPAAEESIEPIRQLFAYQIS